MLFISLQEMRTVNLTLKDFYAVPCSPIGNEFCTHALSLSY